MFWEILLGCFLYSAPLISFASFDVAPTFPSLVPVVDSITVEAYAPGTVPFHVRFGDRDNAFRVMAMFVLPSQTIPVSIASMSAPGDFELASDGGVARAAGDGAWTWTAPATPGLYPVAIHDRDGGATMTLNVFVMVPYASLHRATLNGYRIGRYPASPNPSYARPEGFVEVRPGMEDIAVSPHFTLGQFLCKQPGGPFRYLVLREPLLVKLEQLLALVNERGVDAHTFQLMSAYRTPAYNAAIGNTTTLSRHHYGDAADIFVDEDGDGRMDDLDRDGRSSLADARWLGRIVNQTQYEPEFFGLTGGLGMYEPTHAHGAFVHVDVRGFPARWGA